MKKQPIDYILRPFRIIIKNEAAIGILLFLSAVAALFLANSPWAEAYHHFWKKKLEISFENEVFSMDLHHLINDGLMAIFFFLVGLEIKREFLAGQLSTFKQALLPVGAAVGGMLFPALIYLAFNSGEAADGWGIPMATDIAFALGLLSLVRDRISVSVKIFITSLAVVDDIGAVLVIAFFYTSNLNLGQLYWAGGAFILLIVANRMGVRNVFFYSFIGIGGIWLAFFYSGIHPTIAGILLAFAIPAKYRINRQQFTTRLQELHRELLRTDTMKVSFNTHREDDLLSKIRAAGDDARTPLQKIEHGLHPFVYFIIMPLFAFSNAGITMEENFLELLLEPVSLGIIGGLVVGKFIGITLISRMLVWMKVASMPTGSNWNQITGASFLAGIGFTMSLFISELAFSDPILLAEAKTAILVASALATIIGVLLIRFTNPPLNRLT